MTIAFIMVWLTAILIWCALFRYCSQLIREVRCGNYKRPLIKQIVIRYDNCKKLNISINSIDIFVEKIIENYKVCGLSIMQWGMFAKVLEYILVFIGTSSIIVQIIEKTYMLSYSNRYEVSGGQKGIYVAAVIYAVCIMIVHSMEHVWEKKMVIRTLIVEIVDYLENSGELRIQAEECIVGKLRGDSANEFARLRKNYKKIQASVNVR